VAAAPAATQKAAATPDDKSAGDKPWYKDAHNLIPLLSAISAMGTAKTVHPGVALAAGLGAGANSYVGTQQALAKAAETQAVTQGLQNQNVVSGVKAQQAQAMFPPSGGVVPQAQPAAAPTPTAAAALLNSTQPPSTTSAPSDAAQTAAGAYQEAKSKYFVNTARTPEEQAAKDQAIKKDWILGGDANEKQADTDFQNRVAKDTLAAQQSSRQDASGLYAQATDPNASESARQAAAVRYNAAMQFSGSKYTSLDGSIRDEASGRPAVGAVAQTLTPAQLSAKYSEAWSPVQLGNDLPKPAWQAYKFASPDAYVRSQPGASGAPAAPTGGAPPAQQTAAAAAPPAPSAAPRTAAAPTARAAPAPAAQAPTSAPASADPYTAQALADKSADLKPPPPVTDASSVKKINALQEASVAKRTQVLNDAAQAIPAASQSLQYLQAAKSIIDSHGTTVGAYGPLIASASRWIGETPDSSNYQQLAKYLGNAAVAAGNANFRNPTEKMMGLQLQEFSPSEKMNDDTINHLIRTNMNSAQWTIDSAMRAKLFMDANKDPFAFDGWNQNHWKREVVVNADRTATLPNGTKIYRVNGRKVYADGTPVQ
jgi:hypothetical protein